MQFLFELILHPIFEFLVHGVGYATAYVIVPIFTWGRVVVAPQNGRRQLDAETAGYIGVLFWIVVAVFVFWLRS